MESIVWKLQPAKKRWYSGNAFCFPRLMIGLSFLRMRACYLYLDDIANHIFKYIFLSIFRYISQLFTSQQWYARLCCIRMRSWSLADVVLPVLFCICAAVSYQLKQVPSSFGWSGQKVFLYQVSQLNSHLPLHCRTSIEMLFLVLPWNLVRVSSW